MLQSLKKRFKRPKKDFPNYFDRLFNNPLNSWIRDNKYIQLAFFEVFRRLDEFDLKVLITEKDLIFLKSGGILSCAVAPSENTHIILLFPDIVKLLLSPKPELGEAVLAHELGHIILGHGKKSIDSLHAQIEADSFAAKLGYRDELIQILLDYENCLESQVRLTYLRTKLY